MYDIFLFLFCALLVFGAISDLRTFEIPNFVSVVGAILFFPAAFLAQLEAIVFASHLLAAGMVLGIGFGLFVANLLGGGDVKVLSAVALWCRLTHLLALLFWVAVAGGVLAGILFLFRLDQIPRWAASSDWLKNLQSETGVPYPVANNTGALWDFFRNSVGM